MFGFATGQRSTAGDFRDGNEDSLYTSPWSAFVADGVGGNAGGEVASATVTIRLAATLDATRGLVHSAARLRELVGIANADLELRSREDPRLAGLATTLTGVFSDGERVRVAHVGDSRAYLLRDGELHQVTRDDSLVQDLLDAGQLTPELARIHPYRSVVMNVLGGALEDAAGLHVLEVAARAGDRWLLASDGLTDYVPETTVREQLAADATPQDVADRLVDTAVALHARDNVTVVVADVVELAAEPEYAPAFGGSAAEDPASSRGV